jgi:hypothetical protein
MARHYPVYDTPVGRNESDIVDDARDYIDDSVVTNGMENLSIRELIINAYVAGFRRCEENASEILARVMPDIGP